VTQWWQRKGMCVGTRAYGARPSASPRQVPYGPHVRTWPARAPAEVRPSRAPVPRPPPASCRRTCGPYSSRRRSMTMCGPHPAWPLPDSSTMPCSTLLDPARPCSPARGTRPYSTLLGPCLTVVEEGRVDPAWPLLDPGTAPRPRPGALSRRPAAVTHYRLITAGTLDHHLARLPQCSRRPSGQIVVKCTLDWGHICRTNQQSMHKATSRPRSWSNSGQLLDHY
jgi:hypothetical protein